MGSIGSKGKKKSQGQEQCVDPCGQGRIETYDAPRSCAPRSCAPRSCDPCGPRTRRVKCYPPPYWIDIPAPPPKRVRVCQDVVLC